MRPNNIKKILVTIILLLVLGDAFSQNIKAIDSLTRIIDDKKIKDSTLIIALIELSSEYDDVNLDSAIYFSDLALKKAIEIGNVDKTADAYRRKGSAFMGAQNILADSLLRISMNLYFKTNNDVGIIKCYINLGEIFLKKGDNYSALEQYELALKVATEKNLPKYIPKINNNLGVVYSDMSEFEKAIEKTISALKGFELLNDEEHIGMCNLNIGSLFIETNEFEKAKYYLEKAQKIFEKLNLNYGQSSCLGNLGYIYFEQKEYKKALENYNQALSLDIKSKDFQRIATKHINIGNIYREFLDFDKAKSHYKNSMDNYSKIGDNSGIAECYLSMAKLEKIQNNYAIAESYCLKSVELFKSNLEKNDVRIALEELANIYYCAGKADQAYDVQIKASTLKDSLFTIDKAKKISKLEERYVNERLERQNEKLSFEKELQQTIISQQKMLRNIYLIGFVLSLVAAIIIFIQFKKKNEAYRFLVKKNLEVLKRENEIKIIKGQVIPISVSSDYKGPIPDEIRGQLLNKLIKIVENDKIYIKPDLTLDKLAKRLATNRSYLSQLIHDEFNKSYSDYINEYKVKEAMYLLSDSKKAVQYSIEALAKDAGFKSVSRFNAVFKKATGITPSTFRQEAIVLNNSKID